VTLFVADWQAGWPHPIVSDFVFIHCDLFLWPIPDHSIGWEKRRLSMTTEACSSLSDLCWWNINIYYLNYRGKWNDYCGQTMAIERLVVWLVLCSSNSWRNGYGENWRNMAVALLAYSWLQAKYDTEAINIIISMWLLMTGCMSDTSGLCTVQPVRK